MCLEFCKIDFITCCIPRSSVWIQEYECVSTTKVFFHLFNHFWIREVLEHKLWEFPQSMTFQGSEFSEVISNWVVGAERWTCYQSKGHWSNFLQRSWNVPQAIRSSREWKVWHVFAWLGSGNHWVGSRAWDQSGTWGEKSYRFNFVCFPNI